LKNAVAPPTFAPLEAKGRSGARKSFSSSIGALNSLADRDRRHFVREKKLVSRAWSGDHGSAGFFD
jgi:hypothetical protein